MHLNWGTKIFVDCGGAKFSLCCSRKWRSVFAACVCFCSAEWRLKSTFFSKIILQERKPFTFWKMSLKWHYVFKIIVEAICGNPNQEILIEMSQTSASHLAVQIIICTWNSFAHLPRSNWPTVKAFMVRERFFFSLFRVRHVQKKLLMWLQKCVRGYVFFFFLLWLSLSKSRALPGSCKDALSDLADRHK